MILDLVENTTGAASKTGAASILLAVPSGKQDACRSSRASQYRKAACVGLSPFVPNGNALNAPFELFCRYHVPSDGRKTQISAFPSPSKSPGAGISVANPKTLNV